MIVLGTIEPPKNGCKTKRGHIYKICTFWKNLKISPKESYRPKTFAHSNKNQKKIFFHFFADNFFSHESFWNFFNGFEISIKFCVFSYPYWNHFWLFANFEVKRGQNGLKKRKNIFWRCVLELNLAIINGQESQFVP